LKNPKVALVKNSLQIEGTAELCGHPSEKQNEKFTQLLKKYRPDSYNMYSCVESEVVVKVIPYTALDWLYEAGDNNMYFYDFINHKVKTVNYTDGKSEI
jgi:hypothetical protein